MNPQSRQLLIDAVRSGNLQSGCALERLRIHMGTKTCMLTNVAAEAGFSSGAAYGIMDGWDLAAGGYTNYDDRSVENGYEEGRSLGREMFLLSGGEERIP